MNSQKSTTKTLRGIALQLTAMFGGLWLVACGAKVGGGENGGNTNWITACDRDADCDAEDRCITKTCLTPCASDGACGVANTACESLEAAVITPDSCDMESAQAYCSLRCEDDGDCVSLGAFSCEEGACRPSCSKLVASALQQDGGTLDGGEPAVGEPDVLPSATGQVCDPRLGCDGGNLFCVADGCDQLGRCAERGPISCDTDYKPVCGCEGQTYDNLCTAGGTIAHEGQCDDPVHPAANGTECVIAMDVGACCSSGAVAVTRQHAEENDCLFQVTDGDLSLPDGISEECFAACPEIPCPPSDPAEPGFLGRASQAAGGSCVIEPVCDDASCPGSPCDASVGCDPNWRCEGDSCGVEPELKRLTCVAESCGERGNCAVTEPTPCDGNYEPMCGCDGQTYSNRCEAGRVPIAHEGECM